MAKIVKGQKTVSREEWSELPVTLDAPAVARVTRCGLRYVQDHAEQLGGVKLGSKWLFSKTRLATMLGIEEG